ncbi:MAG: SDR family NAD(P)-dependent oxidoreductase [Clostridiales bacterium]|nr:SDR family NAD(P)-dependent oxidoreductase [Clostridiales bacterium]
MRVLITGTMQGLGLELTKEGLKRGHSIVAAQLKYNDAINELLEKYPDNLHVEIMDVTDNGSVTSAAASVEGRFGAIDGIINNAAILLETKFDTSDQIADMPLDVFERTMDVNITGVVRVCKAFMPLAYKGGDDRFVINITSEGAKLHGGGIIIYPAYTVSKYALNMYTQILRNYVAEKSLGFRVWMVHPGRMHTVMGAENAQIQPLETAENLWDIIERKKPVEHHDVPFINYKGEYMLDL